MTSSRKQSLEVPETAAGTRLDKWLAETLPQLSRSRLKALIEEGAVTVSSKPQNDPAFKVKAGQWVAIHVPAAVEAEPEPQDIPLSVVYEDDDLIVIDKPAGLVVHPAAGNPDFTLVNALLAHCGNSLKGIGGVRRPGIVHRIDKDTSGLLVAAKTETAHAGLSAQFAEHSIERTYQALVWGIPKPLTGDVIGNIGRSRFNRKKMAIVARGGKFAKTHYETIVKFGNLAAHVECKLTTGRTHQIRVHMSNRGHALIGDKLYGGGRTRSLEGLPADLAAALKEFPRQALHAATLGFVHPGTNEMLRFESPLPDDFVELREALSWLP